MDTLGQTVKGRVPKEESWSINHKAVAATALPKAAIVKLNASGEVEAVSATTDVAYGILSVGCKEAGEYVTVQTQFNTITDVTASGAVAIGDKLAAEALVDGVMKYKKAVAGDTVAAIALTGGANTAKIRVGVLRTFFPL